MVDKKIEKNDLSDASESIDYWKKIDQWLQNLERQADEYFAKVEKNIHTMEQPFEQQDSLYNSTDEINNLHASIDIQSLDEKRENLQPLQDEKRVVSDKKLSSSFQIPLNIKNTLAEASESPESEFGRQESYAQVESFANAVRNEKGLFGRLVKMLS